MEVRCCKVYGSCYYEQERNQSNSHIHRRRGTIGNRAWNEEIRNNALAIVETYYPDFGPTFAAEKLAKKHAIVTSRETLCKAMIREGPWCTLLVCIDDATSQVLWLEFVESESLKGVMQATAPDVEAQIY